MRKEPGVVETVTTAEDEAPRRGRGRPPLDTAARRRHILDCAKELFLSRGFTNTSVDAIGSAAGVTKRTIYELVGDKEAVFRTICVETMTRHSELRFDRPIGNMNVHEAFLAVAHMLLAHALAPDMIAMQRVTTFERTLFPDLVQDILQASQTRLHAAILSVFEDIMAHELIGRIDADHAVEVFYDAVIGNRGFRAMLGYEEAPATDAELDERITMFLEGYVNRRPERD